jgi:hypothetical protein
MAPVGKTPGNTPAKRAGYGETGITGFFWEPRSLSMRSRRLSRPEIPDREMPQQKRISKAIRKIKAMIEI